MKHLYPALLETAAASLFLIPFFLHREVNKKSKTTVMQILFAIYLSAVYAIAGLPNIRYVRFHPNLNTTPFLYMFSDHNSSFLNVLLFLPLGIMLPLLWTRFRSIFRTILCGFFLSAAIEFLQLFTYRATDVNDLITNTLGTLLGYLIGMLLAKRIPNILPCTDTNAFSTVVSAVFYVMFFFQPLFIRIILYII